MIMKNVVALLRRKDSQAMPHEPQSQIEFTKYSNHINSETSPARRSIRMSPCCIALTTDQNYLLPTLVSAITARKHSSSENADVFVLSFGCDNESRRVFDEIFELEGIHFVNSHLDMIERAPAMMARLFLPQLVPSRYQQG